MAHEPLRPVPKPHFWVVDDGLDEDEAEEVMALELVGGAAEDVHGLVGTAMVTT